MRKRCLQICAAITRQNVNISDALYLMNAIPTLFVPTHDVTIESVSRLIDESSTPHLVTHNASLKCATGSTHIFTTLEGTGCLRRLGPGENKETTCTSVMRGIHMSGS